MTKICAIGDSQIGPLVLATRLDKLPNIDEVIFFASHVNLMTALNLEGRKLQAGTAELAKSFLNQNKIDHIDIDLFDQIIIIGLNFSMLSTALLYYHYTSDSMSPPTPGKYMISELFYVEAAESRVERCEALRIVRMIRSVSDVPITLVSGPNPGEGLPEERILKGFPPYHAIVSNGDDIPLASIFKQACVRVGEKYHISVVPPIPDVAANGVFNKREFSSLPQVLDPNLEVDYNNQMVHAGGNYYIYLAKFIF